MIWPICKQWLGPTRGFLARTFSLDVISFGGVESSPGNFSTEFLHGISLGNFYREFLPGISPGNSEENAGYPDAFIVMSVPCDKTHLESARCGK